MMFLTASNVQHSTIIQEAYGDKVDPDSFEWKNARQKIYDNVKLYKTKVLDKVIVST